MDYNFRTLNYLGSKLRLLDFIEENVLNITPQNTGVCDLFAGSGCVSRKLSNRMVVTACDIQEYSKVISSALLHNYSVSNIEKEQFACCLRSWQTGQLFDAFMPLITLEENAIKTKDLETLTSILEHGSVEVYRLEHIISCLAEKQDTVWNTLTAYNMNDEKSLISRYYGGVYFSYKQAVEIDIILEAIHRCIDKDNQNLYLAALLSTASDAVDTVGKHFAQPIKARDSKGNIKNTVYNKAVKDKTIDVVALFYEWLAKYEHLSKNSFAHTTMRGDFEECLTHLPDNVRTVYADPPYTRDHYSRFYHVLETIALRDTPQISKVTIHGATHISNGIYREYRHQSPFCIKREAPAAFKRMFRIVSDKNMNLLLSYSPYDETKKTHPRVVTLQKLMAWAGECFTNVDVVSAGVFKHNKLNSSIHHLEASEEAEVLIVCTNQE